jgi:hypothetical protein
VAGAVVRFTLGAAGEVDLATVPDIENMLDLRMPPRYPSHPYEAARWTPKSASVLAPASGYAVLKLGRPQAGRQFNIRSVCIMGSDDHTILTGTYCGFYIGDASSLTGTASVPNLGENFLPGSQGGAGVTVPANAQFGSKGAMCTYPNEIYATVYGATSGQQLVAVCWYWDEPQTDEGYS